MADQHCNQVSKFWSFTNKQDFGAFSSKHLEDFVQNQLKTSQPGTVKSYLCSILNFIKFAFGEQLFKDPVKTLNECNEFIRNSGKVLSKLQQQRQVEVDERANKDLLKPEARLYILNGDYIQQTFQVFKRQPQIGYVDFRNALMLLLTISNGPRVSSLMNRTISQVRDARSCTVQDIGYRIISVSKHKTSASRGAQKLSLPDGHYAYIL